MKLVLLADVKKNMKKGQIVEVADGYANYLLSAKLAEKATNKVINEARAAEESMNFKKQQEEQEARSICDRINNGKITLTLKAGGMEGKFTGSITSHEIADKISEQYGVEISKKKIVLQDTIKAPGNYNVEVKVYANLSANVLVSVVKE